MALIYYKFKSAKEFFTLPIEGNYISVGCLKDKIFDAKKLGKGKDINIALSNPQTDEEYLDEKMLVPKFTSVVVRRIPGMPRKGYYKEGRQEVKSFEVPQENSVKAEEILSGAKQCKLPDDYDCDDEFGSDPFSAYETHQEISTKLPQQTESVSLSQLMSKEEEDAKMKSLLAATAADWQSQLSGSSSRLNARGVGPRTQFGCPSVNNVPPPGYVCHRCHNPGHFIKYCPTNGDPSFDFKPRTGISQMMPCTDEAAAFEKQVEGIGSKPKVGNLPPELHCPLCKEVMKEAVITSTCCFNSYCDKCIREYLISKSMCICGKKNVLADHLLPNRTLRETIERILGLNICTENTPGSFMQVQATESGNCSKAKALSSTVSGCSKDPSKGPISVGNTSAQQSKESSEVINPQKSPHSVLENSSVSSAERRPQENVSAAGKDAQKSHGDDEVKSKSKVKKSYPTPSSLGHKHRNSYGNIGSQHSSLPHPTASQSQTWAAPDPRQNVYMIPQGSVPPYGACFMPHGVYGAQGYPLGSPYPVSGNYMGYHTNNIPFNGPVNGRQDSKRKRPCSVNEDFAKGPARRKMRTNSQTASSGTASEHGY